MVAVPVVLTAAPESTVTDPKLMLVIDRVQLIAALAGIVMQQMVRADVRIRIRSFRMPLTVVSGGRSTDWTGSAGAIAEDAGSDRHGEIPENTVIGRPPGR
jgi:hypothetical protein